jgi:hypothetical protein
MLWRMPARPSVFEHAKMKDAVAVSKTPCIPDRRLGDHFAPWQPTLTGP